MKPECRCLQWLLKCTAGPLPRLEEFQKSYAGYLTAPELQAIDCNLHPSNCVPISFSNHRDTYRSQYTIQVSSKTSWKTDRNYVQICPNIHFLQIDIFHPHKSPSISPFIQPPDAAGPSPGRLRQDADDPRRGPRGVRGVRGVRGPAGAHGAGGGDAMNRAFRMGAMLEIQPETFWTLKSDDHSMIFYVLFDWFRLELDEHGLILLFNWSCLIDDFHRPQLQKTWTWLAPGSWLSCLISSDHLKWKIWCCTKRQPRRQRLFQYVP